MQKVFSVRDNALGQFMNPFTAPSTGFALRSFTNEVNNNDSPFNKNPEDFEMFEIGAFNPEDGTLMPMTPHSVSRAKELLAKAA